MVQAYLLIQTDVGKSGSVAATVRDMEGVVQIDEVTGPYDIICRLEADSVEVLGKIVLAQVQEVAGIHRTLTCTVVHG